MSWGIAALSQPHCTSCMWRPHLGAPHSGRFLAASGGTVHSQGRTLPPTCSHSTASVIACARSAGTAWSKCGTAHCNTVKRSSAAPSLQRLPGCRSTVLSVQGVKRVSSRTRRMVRHCQVPETEERAAVEKLPNSTLRQQLKQLGAEVRYVFDRSELVDMLVTARQAARIKVVRVPLRQCTATAASPKAYIIVPLDVEDEGFVDFALDTGASGTLITPELRDRLGLSELSGSAVQGLGVTGMTLRQKVQLPTVRLGQQVVPLQEAIVNPLRSASLVDAGVGGMLGMEFLCQFDIELDFTKKQAAFYPAGSAQKGGLLDTTRFSTLTCTPLIGGLRSVMASINSGPGFQAVLDLATVFSIANWKAAAMAGLQEVVETPIQGLGMDSNAIPIYKPTKPLMLQLGDEAKGDDPVSIPTKALLVSDLPAFTILRLSDGPAALIGLDVLQQPRVILSLSTNKLHLEISAFPPEEGVSSQTSAAIQPTATDGSPAAEV